ncbi:hypothetical protein [Pseudoclavibacter sp. Z016]|uniref:hypothetical protein n=1 Tax=Pseudoclavibacter sp. Z016 TaxID=2080581 RepID=UPI001CA493DD|nr:hypothetical protein [Pseudoclavibacter sp. Z016]
MRQDETLLGDRDRWVDELTDEMHRIGGDHIMTEYDHETGGRPSSRAVQDTPYVTTSDLERKVSDAIERVTMFHVPNAEHSTVMAERGGRGGKVSKTPKRFTQTDFYPVAHLTKAEQMEALRCSESTVKRLRREYKESIGELPTGGSRKPSIPPGILDSSTGSTEQQEATAAVATHPPVDTPPPSTAAVATALPVDTPASELVQHYEHEDLPPLLDFMVSYDYLPGFGRKLAKMADPQRRWYAQGTEMNDLHPVAGMYWERYEEERLSALYEPEREQELREECRAIALEALT